MSKDTVPSTWSVGPRTLAAAIAIAAIVLVAPITTYFVARHQVASEQRVHQSLQLMLEYERLRPDLGTTTPATDAASMAAAERLRLRLHNLQQMAPQSAPGNAHRLESLAALPDAGSPQARNLFEAAWNAEVALYAERSRVAKRATYWLYATVALAAALTPLTLAWLLARIRSELLSRQWFEKQLQEANRLLESVLENMPAMLFVKDAAALRFVRVNRAAERIIGYPREQLLGRSDHDFFPAEQADYFVSKDRETLAQGDVVEIPHEEIDTGDHGRRTLHTLKVPIRDRHGNPSLLLGISLDITQQRAAERRVATLNEELIQQARLLQSSNEELESFCYSVSHDLRAPLRAINGYARLLEQDYSPNIDAQGKRYIQTICGACERMAHLIDDLLEFSRIGRQGLQLETIDMQAAVRRAIDEAALGREAPMPDIDVATLPPARGDRTLLQLVWLNLIDNAVKYTAGVAAPRIVIQGTQQNNEAVFTVTDNGIGFDMQHAARLFSVFERLHADARYPGTGVGLAIVQRIVDRHGGRVWAHSEPDRGATFSFSIPSR